jgi:hypothetical protein
MNMDEVVAIAEDGGLEAKFGDFKSSAPVPIRTNGDDGRRKRCRRLSMSAGYYCGAQCNIWWL